VSKEWLAAKGVKPKCSQCGGESLEEMEHSDRWGRLLGLLGVESRSGRYAESSRSGFTVYPLICTNCGHVLFFSAKKMGYRVRGR
jgi:ribosomal protein S27AE